MSFVEKFADGAKKLARPAAAAGGIGAALLAPDSTPSYIQTPIAHHLDKNSVQIHNPNILVWNPDATPSIVLVDDAKKEATPYESVLRLLAKESRELTADEYGEVFDLYFEKAMEKFKTSGKRVNPMHHSDGAAAYNTAHGYGISLTRNYIHDNTIAADGVITPVQYTERTLGIYNLIKDSEDPNYLSTTIYVVKEGMAPFVYGQETKTSAYNQTQTTGYPHVPIGAADLFVIANLLHNSYNSPDKSTLPLSFRPPQRIRNY